MREQIIKLRSEGYSDDQILQKLKLSMRTFSAYKAQITRRGEWDSVKSTKVVKPVKGWDYYSTPTKRDTLSSFSKFLNSMTPGEQYSFDDLRVKHYKLSVSTVFRYVKIACFNNLVEKKGTLYFLKKKVKVENSKAFEASKKEIKEVKEVKNLVKRNIISVSEQLPFGEIRIDDPTNVKLFLDKNSLTITW